MSKALTVSLSLLSFPQETNGKKEPVVSCLEVRAFEGRESGELWSVDSFICYLEESPIWQ